MCIRDSLQLAQGRVDRLLAQPAAQANVADAAGTAFAAERIENFGYTVGHAQLIG